MTPARIAFLDFDHTLLAADSNQLWLAYLKEHGFVTAEAIARHERFMDDYGQGRLDFAALQSFRDLVDAAIEPRQLAAHRTAFAEQRLLPALAAGAQPLVEHLHGAGLLTMVVSASREALVVPAARRLGVGHVVGADSQPDLDTPCFGAGKIRHVEAALSRLGSPRLEDLAESWFYTDSSNDLPLLEAVRHPVAVDPDPVLARTARQRSWPLISLRAGA